MQTLLGFRIEPVQHAGTIKKQEYPLAWSTLNAKRHGRAILTEQYAREIFCNKPAPGTMERTRAGSLSKVYGVSVKTIRDIWIGRTWYRATCHLDQTQPLAPERRHKKAGRPKGVKDSKKRVKKSPSDIEVVSSVQGLTQNPIVAAKGHGRTLANPEDPRTNPREADVQPASPPITPNELDPPLFIGPDFPEELQADRFQGLVDGS